MLNADDLRKRDRFTPSNGVANGYAHGEAFCLMVYRCQRCGVIEVLWNSRDGVTPFGISCRTEACNTAGDFGSPMLHDLWKQDTCLPEFKPWPGMRIFRDLRPDEMRAVMQRRMERAVGTPYEVPRGDWPAYVEAAVGDMTPGEPTVELVEALTT